jgi:hypothetical protein
LHTGGPLEAVEALSRRRENACLVGEGVPCNGE